MRQHLKDGKWLILPGIAIPLTMVIFFLVCIPPDLFDKPYSTVLLDENGSLMTAVIARDDQWRFPSADSLPKKFEASILMFEDKNFYSHRGIYLPSILRAIKQNIEVGKVVSGGSTITMQVIRLSRDNPPRTIGEKVLEMIRAFRLETIHSKEEILSFYAANAPMGGNVVGLDAASWRYFGRPAHDLTWAETASLAVLPNAPGLIFPGRNQDKFRDKRNRLLKLLYEDGHMSQSTYELSLEEPLPSKPKELPQLTPHLIQFAHSHGKGRSVSRTTINRELQIESEAIVSRHLQSLKGNHIKNAAVIVIDNENLEVKTYLGNCTLDPEGSSGGVDIIQAPRSTGSILKPLLYAMMIDDGELLPNALVPDVPVNFGGYSPQNYQREYFGAVSASQALSQSLNIPSVLMLKKYGVDRFLHQLRSMKFSHLNNSADHYGLSLILGGGEASLWDISSAYAGMSHTLIKFHELNTQYVENPFDVSVFSSTGEKDLTQFPILSASSIYQTFEALLEVNRPVNQIGWEAFSSSQNLAWKTGTSFGFRDAWAVGTNGKYTIGVWVGNADGEGRPGIVGVKAAAPILFDIADQLPSDSWFMVPYEDMQEASICHHSGFLAGAHCEQVEKRWISPQGLSSSPCPFHRTIHVHKETGDRASLDCLSVDEIKSEKFFVLPAVQEWYYKVQHPQYVVLPKFHPGCDVETETRSIGLIYPKHSATIYIPTNLEGEEEKIVLKAAHRVPEKTIFWYLDNKFIGETNTIHVMEISPKPGDYQLVLMDEEGEEFRRSLAVLQKHDLETKK